MGYTVFEYMYRDAANYKVHSCLWLEGDLNKEEKVRFPLLLEEGELFIAEQVSVPTLRSEEYGFGNPTADDHVWHTFAGFRLEVALPRDEKLHGTCSEFFMRFETVAGNWRIECSDAHTAI